MSLPPATSRAALPFTQRLLGAENFDNSFFEYTSVILAGEDLTEMATNCAQVVTVRKLRRSCDELIKLEKTAISRSCALVYASLSPTFKPHVSLDFNLQAFDKMRTAAEKLERRPLRDSHLASALLAALPEYIAPDLFVWCGTQPSIPYKNMRQLLEQHWPGLVTKYPHYLGPAPIAAAAPDELPSHLSNYPQVEVVDAIKADQAATAVANAMAKAVGVVEEPGHPSSTPFAKVTYQVVHRATLPAAIQATPASTTALIAKINAAVARFVSRPPAIAVAQATGTATTAKTAAITATNQDDRRYRSRSHSMYADRRHRSRSAALPVR
ncbi:hypothetical protein B5M09_009165 [Aphanomyces astaci]|uniref:Uncharacterized protein n=1 Tax=Aphanomyces astaci TaxID=112090 RepID=A0A3R7WD00_APHAT|nr:hypothetical protein B5M09_009165 [Aphanomyces astaci]